MNYQHILLVTDLKEDADIVAQKAKSLLEHNNASLSVLNIVENSMVGIGYEYMSVAVFNEIDQENAQTAQVTMQEFLKRNQLHTEHAEVSIAMSSAMGIVEYCDEHHVDLLVIGRHERHGLSAIFTGSTVDNILSKISCDVLVVHLDKPKS